MNGQSAPGSWISDGRDAILFHHILSQTTTLGRIEGKVDGIEARVDRVDERLTTIEQQRSDKPKETKRPEIVTYLIAGVIVAAASVGKVTWSQALPSLIALVGGGK